MIPSASTDAPPPASTSSSTPVQASGVARAQRPVSGSPSSRRPATPARAGADPSATTVPTATPVRSTAAKNESWYMAIAAAITPSSRRGHGAAAAGTARATSSSRAPPMAIREAPTVSGAASGPSAWAVPVVPKQTAARRTRRRGITCWIVQQCAWGVNRSGSTSMPAVEVGRRRLRRDRLVLGLDERGFPALWERDVDRVEVARHDGRRERRARLVAHLAREVARRQVREREQPHARVPRKRGGLARGRVRGVARACALVLQERRLVNEHVGLVRVDLGRLERPRVARDHDPAARPRRPDDLLRAHAADLLPAL